MWCAMSRPSMLPLKYRTLRMRSQTKLNDRPASWRDSGARGASGAVLPSQSISVIFELLSVTTNGEKGAEVRTTLPLPSARRR